MLPTAVSVACTMPTASPDVPEMIVIVDDDPLMRRTMAANLEDAGYRTTSFDGGQTVLQYFSGGGLAAAVLLDSGTTSRSTRKPRSPAVPWISSTSRGAFRSSCSA